MIDLERKSLKELQKILMSMYAGVESNSEQYGNFQVILDEIDSKADRIRWILEGRDV